jgi:hypothetical protein
MNGAVNQNTNGAQATAAATTDSYAWQKDTLPSDIESFHGTESHHEAQAWCGDVDGDRPYPANSDPSKGLIIKSSFHR